MKKRVYHNTFSGIPRSVVMYEITKHLTLHIITDPFNETKLFEISKYDLSDGEKFICISIYKKPKGA